jgi:hypothetical protein
MMTRYLSGQKVEPEGITQFKLNPDGECTQFLEWWNPKTDVLTAGATTQCNYGARAHSPLSETLRPLPDTKEMQRQAP